MKATFSHGDSVVMVDYTAPTGGVEAGDVVEVGDGVRIAHKGIEAGELGALAIAGGVYDIAKDTGTGTAIDDGAYVYWDLTAGEATDDSTGNNLIGVAVGDAENDDETVRVYHIQPSP